MPPKKNKTTPSEIKQANLEQSVRYSDPERYQDLVYNPNPNLDKIYKNWKIRPDRFSKEINVSDYFKKEVEPYMQYFDTKYESAWEKKVYNLTVKPNIKFKSITIQDIQSGKFLALNDDKNNNQIAQKTENSYIYKDDKFILYKREAHFLEKLTKQIKKH